MGMVRESVDEGMKWLLTAMGKYACMDPVNLVMG
jgi:hypothetical protein